MQERCVVIIMIGMYRTSVYLNKYHLSETVTFLNIVSCSVFSLRWPSFQISNRLSHSVASLQITNQSAGQLSLLQRFSLLRLTAIMEKYSMSNKHGWTW